MTHRHPRDLHSLTADDLGGPLSVFLPALVTVSPVLYILVAETSWLFNFGGKNGMSVRHHSGGQINLSLLFYAVVPGFLDGHLFVNCHM